MKKYEAAHNAVKWALQQVGSPYSQARRTQEGVFDCSSLVARAYSAQGKKWKKGGEVPISMYEVYDDDFELIWPESYAAIGQKLGGKNVIAKARQAGDLQFICTDSATKRSNRITHVAMVADANSIVHARSTKHGVCKNSLDLYSGKICAVIRYNPEGALRKGMCGWRTLRLQQSLNRNGFNVAEDGEYGNETEDAVCRFQEINNMRCNGIADAEVLQLLEKPDVKKDGKLVVTGNSVHLRKGPGAEYEAVTIVKKGDLLYPVETDGWSPVKFNEGVLWIRTRYVDKS